MVLHGWKQIARYLGCGIRTAQRWESECRLPVTRPRKHLRSPVLAHSEALDAWASGVSHGGADQWDSRFARLEREIEALKRQVMLLGAEPAVSDRDRRHPAAADGQAQLAAKAPTFDA